MIRHWTLVFALALTMGCGDTQRPQLVVGGADGNGVAAPPQIPKDFPTDLPVYPGSEVTNVDREETELTVTFGTADPMDAVAQFLRTELPKKGWKFKESPAQGGLIFDTTKGTKIVAINLGRSPDRTFASATVSQKPAEEEKPDGHQEPKK